MRKSENWLTNMMKVAQNRVIKNGKEIKGVEKIEKEIMMKIY